MIFWEDDAENRKEDFSFDMIISGIFKYIPPG